MTSTLAIKKLTRAVVILRPCFVFLLAVFWGGGAVLVQAEPGPEPGLSGLLDEGKLEIKTWVEPQESIVVSQQVILNVEVATHRWFTGGTQIGPLEIDDAVVLRRDRFAVNSSRRQGGESWAVQLWSLTIYPQRAGTFDIPEIPLTLTVSGEDNQPVTGMVNTEALSFRAVVPIGITVPLQTTDKPNWIASTQFEVTEEYDKSFDQLKVGDSLQRSIYIKARDVASMMLPALTFESMKGLTVYQKPPKITDTVNRGDYLAERTENISYVIEQQGVYVLPALTFYWWDLNSQQLQEIILPEKLISTFGRSSNTIVGDQTAVTTKESTISIALKVTLVALIVLLFAILWLIAVRHRGKTSQVKNPVTLKTLQKQFVDACYQQNYIKAVSVLYQWLDHKEQGSIFKQSGLGSVRVWLNSLGEGKLCEQFNLLMQSACGETGSDVKEFEALLQGLKDLSKTSSHQRGWGKPIDLRLN